MCISAIGFMMLFSVHDYFAGGNKAKKMKYHRGDKGGKREMYQPQYFAQTLSILHKHQTHRSTAPRTCMF